MKTKFRFLTIFFALLLLAIFASVPLMFLSTGAGIHDAASLKQAFFSIPLGILFIASVAAIAWLTLRIAIDAERRTITFTYPFRLQSFTYSFDELIGFRYKYLSGKVTYKSLKFRTSGDQRTFSVSDFETANIRELEIFSLNHFELRGGKEFRRLTDREKKSQIRESRHFDGAQAKEIKYHLFVALFALATSSVAMLKAMISSKGTKLYKLGTTVVIMIWITISIINRIRKLRAIIKEADSSEKKKIQQ
jgi:hypothetical protein